MLRCHIPTRSVAIPLHNQQYSLHTDEVGDTTGRVIIDRLTAAQLVGTDVGDEIVIWCNQLHRMVWRGQIEGMTQYQDGRVELLLIGLGRLIGDVPITTVLNDRQTAQWEIAPREWISAPSGLPNPAKWETAKNQYLIATARAGETYGTNDQMMWIYRYPQPTRYRQLSHYRLSVDITTMTGIISTAEIGLIYNNTPPYTTETLATVSSTGSYFVTKFLPVANKPTGWFVRTAIVLGTETATGNTRLIVKPTVQYWIDQLVYATELQDYLSSELNRPIRVQTDYLGSYAGIYTFNNIRMESQPLGTLLSDFWELQQRRSVRIDRLTSTLIIGPPVSSINRRPDWTVTAIGAITRDLSAIPTRVYGQWQDEAGLRYATDVGVITSMAARKRYGRTMALTPIAASQSDAMTQRNDAITQYQTPAPSVRITVPMHGEPTLRTPRHTIVPPWSAEPHDWMQIDPAYTVARIVSRTITESGVTYDVTLPQDDLMRLATR